MVFTKTFYTFNVHRSTWFGVPINQALCSCVLSPDLNSFIMQKFSTNHTKLLTSVYHNLAMLVTGSKDKTVEMFAMSERKNAEEKMEEEEKEEEEEEEEQCVYSFTDHHGDICCVSINSFVCCLIFYLFLLSCFSSD